MTAADPHRWCNTRLPAHLSGLLSAPEEKRILTHLASCADCRQIARDLEAAVGERVERVDGHLPAALLGRWSRSKAELRGLERALVRQHLEQCGDCRDDLESLGYEPALAVVPELELGFDLEPMVLPPEVTPKRSARHGSPVRAQDRGLADRAWDWLGGDGLTALLAPALMLRVTRGDTSANTLDIDHQTRAVALRLPLPPEVAPEAEVHVEVDSPAGAPILRERCRVKDLAPPHLLILANRGEPLSPGTYRMRIASAEPGGFTLETSFDLRAESRGKD